jgi:hypothetical protein
MCLKHTRARVRSRRSRRTENGRRWGLQPQYLSPHAARRRVDVRRHSNGDATCSCHSGEQPHAGGSLTAHAHAGFNNCAAPRRGNFDACHSRHSGPRLMSLLLQPPQNVVPWRLWNAVGRAAGSQQRREGGEETSLIASRMRVRKPAGWVCARATLRGEQGEDTAMTLPHLSEGGHRECLGPAEKAGVYD